jgi:hypothetical protein
MKTKDAGRQSRDGRQAGRHQEVDPDRQRVPARSQRTCPFVGRRRDHGAAGDAAGDDEITDYLAKIDEKLDDVLRAQKDAVLADLWSASTSWSRRP